MGLLDALLSNNSGGGLFDSLFYPTSAPDADAEKKKQDAAFLAAIGQDPYQGVSNPNATPTFQPTGNFPNYGTSPLAGTNAGAYGGSSPFGLGGFNLPAASQGAPASGAFPAVPAMQSPQAPQAAPQMPQMAPPPQMVAPAPQNGPSGSMNIGGYQMPQFGSRADYTPQASTDISAQSRQPPPDQSQGLPSVLQAPNFLGRIGNPDGLIARLTGNDSRSISQQNLRATFDATRAVLLQSGLSNQEATSKAMLAVLNPEAGKVILPEALSNKEKYGIVSDNPLEGKKYGFINERDQTINGRPMGASGSNGAAPEQGQLYDAIAKARDAGATPAQLYQMVPAQFRAGVQAMIEGRALPTTFSARGGARDQALLLAQTIDPTLDEPAIGARSRGNVDFYGGGKSSETMRKANQSALHFGELVDKMQTLPGHAVPAYNSAANFINSELLGKDAKGNFIVNGHALADELSGLFKGAGISDTEIRAWESQLSPDMSEQQQRGMAKTLLGIYRDSVSALDKKRIEAVGPMTAAQKGPILGSDAEAALQKVESFANGKKTNAGGKPSVVIQNGHSYTLQPDGSYK